MKILHLLFCVCIHGAFGAPASPNIASENITFELSAESLRYQDQDDLGSNRQPDAFVIIYNYLKPVGLPEGEMKPFGLTSTISNSNNPEWSDKFPYTWINGTGQTWLLWVFDRFSESRNNLIGVAEVSVDSFMGSGGSLKVELSEKSGSLKITRYSYPKKQKVPFVFKLSARNLPPRDPTDLNIESDPYAVIYYQNGTGKNTGRANFLYQTGYFTDKANPSWPRSIKFTEYKPNTNQTLIFNLYDRDSDYANEILGSATINADEIYQSIGKVIRHLWNSTGIIIEAEIILEIVNHETTESDLYETTKKSKTTIPTTVAPSVPTTPVTSTTTLGQQDS